MDRKSFSSSKTETLCPLKSTSPPCEYLPLTSDTTILLCFFESDNFRYLI